MKIIRRTNIIIKTKRSLTVPSKPAAEIILCPQCAELMTRTQMCANFFEVSSRVIYRLIEAGEIHYIETAVNAIYVCPLSLKNALETNPVIRFRK